MGRRKPSYLSLTDLFCGAGGASIGAELAGVKLVLGVMVTKAAIFGWGLNWQHCHQVLFLGLSDSFEEYYQAIRRCWRFGQACPVDVEIVISEAEGRVAQNVWRKEREHQRTASEVVAAMADAERIAVVGAGEIEVDDYEPARELALPEWLGGAM